MNNKRIRILFYNRDKAGVNYYRTLTPATQLDKDHSNDFDVVINNELDFNDPNTEKYLMDFEIVHYHRMLHPNTNMMIKLAENLRKNGTKLVVDIDDYWFLDKTHPFYLYTVQNKTHLDIMDNLKIADYVTTTTELFAEEIRKVTGKDNVIVLPNSVDPSWMGQFKDKWKEDSDNLLRMNYLAGSSHKADVEQLRGVVNMLDNNSQTKNKFKVILSGWDTDGTTTDVSFNQEFGKELQQKNLWTPQIVKSINNCNNNIDLIKGLPDDIIEKYRGKVFNTKERKLRSDESVYLEYENILTYNKGLIKNDDYKEWLETYSKDKYPEEDNYARRWTRKSNIYAEVLNETDVSLAPLRDTKFNKMKSPLKQVECWSRKLATICTDIPPYNVDGVHMKNTILIPYAKNSHKYWFKAIKQLINEPNLRSDLGNQLHEDFKEKYNLVHVTNNRAEFYKNIID